MTVGQELVLETIQKINQSAETKPQINNKELKPAPKLFKDNCKIKWDKNAKQIMNQIRGLNPYPGAWTLLINNGIKIEIKILRLNLKDNPTHTKSEILFPISHQLKFAFLMDLSI